MFNFGFYNFKPHSHDVQACVLGIVNGRHVCEFIFFEPVIKAEILSHDLLFHFGPMCCSTKKHNVNEVKNTIRGNL